MRRTILLLSRIVIPQLQRKAPRLALIFLLLLIGLVIYLKYEGHPFDSNTILELVEQVEETAENIPSQTQPDLDFPDILYGNAWESLLDGFVLKKDGDGLVYTFEGEKEHIVNEGKWKFIDNRVEWTFGDINVSWEVKKDDRNSNIILIKKSENDEFIPYTLLK